jgi:hypothetical protein
VKKEMQGKRLKEVDILSIIFRCLISEEAFIFKLSHRTKSKPKH